jgi:hypothetical protein
MLKVINYISEFSCTLIVNEPVPLSFRVFPAIRPEPLLWRTGDFERTLFEIKIDRLNGEIFSATLVTFDGSISSYEPTICSPAEIIYGLPVVELDALSGSVIDERSQITVHRGANEIQLHFGNFKRPQKCFCAGRARFLIRSEMLVGIDFSDLTEKEMDLLNASLSRSMARSGDQGTLRV